MAHAQTQEMDEHPEQPPLSRNNSENIGDKRQRSKSRGSTTSLQSVGVGNSFQPAQQPQLEPNMPLDHNGFYVHPAAHPAQAMYAHNPEDVMMQYQHNMAQMHHPGMDQAGGMGHPPDLRPMSRHAFAEMQQYPMQYPHGMPQYGLPPQHMTHMRHQSEQYEGSPAPEDSNNENGGAKRRKGTASSLANDQELRRLLAQYQGKTLKEVANEVQKNEGSGGKSEKAKQVFAMLWLQESCQRSSSSVRRDRVFARYTERCGNERVPTLNPASFGKLVRIIFPNVQTRRLGVRGESKYHYVDLSLFPEEDDSQGSILPDRPSTSSGLQLDRPGTATEGNKMFTFGAPSTIQTVLNSATMETADFPAPSAAFLRKDSEEVEEEVEDQEPQPPKIDCQFTNTPTIRIPTKNMSSSLAAAMPAIRPGLRATMSTYLAMPKSKSLQQTPKSTQEAPIELPDIHVYLAGTNYDPSIAKALFHLYRSYCIDVIDAFRKCKEKPFFNHHSAFNGKMTVPVSKLFSMECLAPWIQECDMRMYKQLIRFVAPLVLQNVPDLVWSVFDRIGFRLVHHLIAAFEEKCPPHAVVAKTVPAARFANLLRKLKGANSAALLASQMLDNPQSRTQMWLDLMVFVDPDRLLDESIPPPESLSYIEGMLKHDFRTLISPIDDPLVVAAEDDPTSTFSTFLKDDLDRTQGLLNEDDISSSPGLLEKWLVWLEKLPRAFEGHHPQCMIDWHARFWASLMTQIGQGSSHSYQSWWFIESLTTQLLGWMTQMEGLLMSEDEQKSADEKEQEKKRHEKYSPALLRPGLKRKRDEVGLSRSQKGPAQLDGSTESSGTTGRQFSQTQSVASAHPEEAGQDLDNDDTDAEFDELSRGPPLDLPSIHTGLSSPIKRQHGVNQHDDSGIDLGLDIDHELEKDGKKFNNRDWLLSSDPVDGPVGLGVLV